MGDAMTNDSEGRSLKPWTKVRDELSKEFQDQTVNFCCGTMMIKLSPVEVVRVASKTSFGAGFDCGRIDTLNRMGKVREALDKIYAIAMAGTNKASIDASVLAREAIQLLDKEISDG